MNASYFLECAGTKMKSLSIDIVQTAFDRCTWGNTRETAADWMALLTSRDEAAKRRLFGRLFLESPDGTDIKALFDEEQIRTYLADFSKALARKHLEKRRRVWRYLYLGERLPIPELDWNLEK